MPDAAARSRLLVLGLDGFDPVVAASLISEGKLPNLARLQDSSLRFELQPGEERYTGLAWEQFSSGLAPERAGRWSAVEVDPKAYRADQPTTRLPPFTERIPCRTAVFDVPYFDIERADGARGMVSWGSHDPGVDRASKPSGLAAEIDERFGDYPAPEWIYGYVWPDPERTREMGRALREALERRSEITRWLFGAKQEDWDLAITVVSEYHSAVEALWHGWDSDHPLHGLPSAAEARDGLVGVYEAGDKLLGDMMDLFADVPLLAYAPHGMGRNYADLPAMLLLPELLYRQATGKIGFQPDDDWPVDGTAPPDPGADWTQTIRRRMDVKRPLADSLRRLASRSRNGDRSVLDWMPAALYRPAWPGMKAYAMPAFYDARVRINLKGREARGVVDPADYRRAVDETAALLEECRDPQTGDRLEADWELREGDPLDRNPTDADLVVRFRRDYYAFDHPRLGRIGPAPCRRPGGHTGGPGLACLRTPDRHSGDLGRFPALEMSAGVAALMGDREADGSLAAALRSAFRDD